MGYNTASVITAHLKAGLFTAWHLILQRRHLCSSMHNDEAPPVEPNSHSPSIPECSTLLHSGKPLKDRLQMRHTFHSQQQVLTCLFSVFSLILVPLCFLANGQITVYVMLPVQHCCSIRQKLHTYYYHY